MNLIAHRLRRKEKCFSDTEYVYRYYSNQNNYGKRVGKLGKTSLLIENIRSGVF